MAREISETERKQREQLMKRLAGRTGSSMGDDPPGIPYFGESAPPHDNQKEK